MFIILIRVSSHGAPLTTASNKTLFLKQVVFSWDSITNESTMQTNEMKIQVSGTSKCSVEHSFPACPIWLLKRAGFAPKVFDFGINPPKPLLKEVVANKAMDTDQSPLPAKAVGWPALTFFLKEAFWKQYFGSRLRRAQNSAITVGAAVQ